MFKKIYIALLTTALFGSGFVYAAINSNIDPVLIQKASLGDATAQYELGRAYLLQGDYANAVKWYEKSVAQENAFAMAGLAFRYYSGQGVKINLKKATELFKKAFPVLLNKAELGNEDAQIKIGHAFELGISVAKDDAKAYYWYKKAAELGNADAQNRTGVALEKGIGVAQDDAKAFYWYNKAAEQGDEWGQNNAGSLYAFGKGVTQDYSKAINLFTKAADQGNPAAQNNLADLYKSGLGVVQDYDKALYWYTKAAAQGNEYAQNSIRNLPVKKDADYYANLQSKADLVDCQNEVKIKLAVNKPELQDCSAIKELSPFSDLVSECQRSNNARQEATYQYQKKNGSSLMELCMYKRNWKNDGNGYYMIEK